MNNLAKFKADYSGALAAAVEEHRDRFALYHQDPAGKEARIAKTVAALYEVLSRGPRSKLGILGSFIIDSPVMRALAKRYGIKNTYKAWHAYLSQAEEQAA